MFISMYNIFLIVMIIVSIIALIIGIRGLFLGKFGRRHARYYGTGILARLYGLEFILLVPFVWTMWIFNRSDISFILGIPISLIMLIAFGIELYNHFS